MQKTCTKNTGFTLLEILIALFILSFSLLGIAALQTSALHHAQDAYLRSVASVQAVNLAERSLAESITAEEINAWNVENATLLPDGTGVYKSLTNYHKIIVSWKSHFSTENVVSLSVY
jgi:type IV pilus assembly protein PilV